MYLSKYCALCSLASNIIFIQRLGRGVKHLTPSLYFNEKCIFLIHIYIGIIGTYRYYHYLRHIELNRINEIIYHRFAYSFFELYKLNAHFSSQNGIDRVGSSW